MIDSNAKQVGPVLEKDSIKRQGKADITATLTSDFDRYGNGSFLMSATRATFVLPDGVEGAVSVDLGGTVVEVKIGERSWNVKLKDLVGAVLAIDAEYLKTAGPKREGVK